MRLINQLCKDIVAIEEKDLKSMRKIADDQQNCVKPLKQATQNKLNALGKRNNKILDELVNLQKLIEENKPE